MKKSTEHEASEVALGKQGCASKLLIQKETEQASAADASFELNSCQMAHCTFSSAFETKQGCLRT